MYCHPFSQPSVALAGVKYTVMNKGLHRQEPASPVAGYQAQSFFLLDMQIFNRKLNYTDEKIARCNNTCLLL